MNARLKNCLMIAAIAGLTILPLLTLRQTASAPGGNTPELFRGTDSQATDAVQLLAPGYKPWFRSIIRPPGSVTESLLFALQAAIGAGFIGYYAGYSRGRAGRSGSPPDKTDEN